MRNLKPWFELEPNEAWNNTFTSTQYGYLMEDARIGSGGNFDIHNWVGRAASKIGQAISGVYGDDRALYNAVIGVQLFSNPTGDRLRRFESTRYVASESGTAAKNWATHFAPGAYVKSGYYGTGTETTMATEWASASAGRALELERSYILNDSNASQAEAWDGIVIQIAAWVAYGATISLVPTLYEAGMELNQSAATGDLGNFRNSCKLNSITAHITQKRYAYYTSVGIAYPSHYVFSGRNTWSLYDPDTYSTVSPQMTGITALNNNQKIMFLQCA